MRTLKISGSSQVVVALSLFSLASCTSLSPVSDPHGSQRAPASLVSLSENDRYLREIQPIFSNRCVVCHTCVDAPCQLHLDTYSSIRRGATFSEMGSSWLEGHPTRPKDATTTAQWRKKGFFPVLAENEDGNAANSPQQNLENSLLYRFIENGFANNQAGFNLHSLNEHRDSDNRCIANVSNFDAFIKEYPGAGMPYGLPALDAASFERLKGWIAEGAPGPSPEAARQLEQPSHPEILEEWESFFNGSPKARLSARYIFEHSFSAHIHFEGTPDDEFYELVRSKTPFPQPVEELVTQRPYDPPYSKGSFGPFYYRFKKFNKTIVRKTHILWELDRARLLSYKLLFLETPWSPQGDSTITDPGYSSNNPFEYFQQIPATVRYRFLLQNSQLIVNAMIRGPVCSGRYATEAIRDHFWVFFVDPSADVTVMDPAIATSEWDSLDTKIEQITKESPQLYNEAMHRLKPQGFSLNDLWKGDGHFPGPVLTILRHDTSASVHYGPQSGMPDAVWLMNFSNFERIYYNLVVDFKPWGNELHKLATWNFMSLHRSEAEERFISLLPTAKLRKTVRTEWTHGFGAFENYLRKRFSEKIPSQIQVRENAPVESLLEQILEQMPKSVTQVADSLTPLKPVSLAIPKEIRSIEDWERGLVALTSRKDAPYTESLPDILYIRIMGRPYTLIANRVYSFNNVVAIMDLAREPEKETLSAFRGLVGDKPEIFIDLKPEQAANFLTDLQAVRSEKDFAALKEVYGIRRNDPRVWTLLDWFQEWDRKNSPLEAGVLDMLEYDAE